MGRGQIKDLTGQKFFRLTPIKRISKNGITYWECVCDCGNVKVVRGSHLTDGSTKSCGCWNKEVQEKFYHRFDGKPRSTRNKGRLYKVWAGMRNRCNNPNNPKYHRYGGRGITICEEWNDYLKFKEWALANGYRDDLTIDRIDNDGNYEPSNCRWATNKEQSNNKSQNHLVTVNGVTHTISEWADITGIPSRRLWMRLHLGIEGERFLQKGDLRNGRKRKQLAV